MKKTALYPSIAACIALALTSCESELDSWNSETFEYAGRFVVAATCQENPALSKIIEKGNEIYLYNTAANIPNEIWLEDVSNVFPLKGKFSLTGNAGNFSAGSTVENTNSIAAIYNADYGEYFQFVASNKSDFPVASAAGQLCDGKLPYVRITLEEGKILPNSATSIGGNVTDSIYLKITLHTDYVQLESYELDVEEREDPDTPEYAWRIKSGSSVAKAEWDEHWIISGYRYTGYPEDL
ncbi:MAG: hypothetical protein LBK18_10490 [Prevotellaceae bacterium]|jgi:hypothetical protein|nr:hypothetical protein [Prevotellaceae bacterium]